MQHVRSIVDVSERFSYAEALADITITGRTSWAAVAPNGAVTLGWRWGLLRNLLFVLDPHRIQTNVRLLDARGSEPTASLARIHLLEYLETLPWRPLVRDCVLTVQH